MKNRNRVTELEKELIVTEGEGWGKTELKSLRWTGTNCCVKKNDNQQDILECEVKWALEIITTNKASGGDGIPVEIFQILKMML